MPAPKGHPKYEGCEKGAPYGYLGKPQDAYTEEDLHSLGKELVEYMNEPKTIWAKGFYNRKGISVDHFNYLLRTYPTFKEYWIQAKAIQEDKIATNSFWKKGDGNFGKFMLARHHEGWQEEEKEHNTNMVYQVNYGSPK